MYVVRLVENYLDQVFEKPKWEIYRTEFRKKGKHKKEERMRVKPKSNYKGKLFDKRKKEAVE